MKIVGIGDLFIPAKHIDEGFAPLRVKGCCVETIDWPLRDFTELQSYNLRIEKEGCQAIQPPTCIFDFCRNADVIVTQFCPVTRELIEACPNLKAIGVLRSGMENVCTEYAANKRIALFNCTGRNAEAVSDFTIGLIIAEARNIARGHYGVRNGQWIRDYPNGGYIPDLPGRTVGLIGCGMIGMKVAKKLSGFDVRVLGYDPYADTERCACEGIELVPLETLMSQSDFVTLHARLTEQNRHLVNAEMISKMKSTAYLINTSRAGLIDEQALVEALRARRIMGAALDVFEQEPLEPGNPILELENVTLTPHMAGGSNDTFFNTPHRLCEQMQAWMEKQG